MLETMTFRDQVLALQVRSTGAAYLWVPSRYAPTVLGGRWARWATTKTHQPWPHLTWGTRRCKPTYLY